MQELNDAVAAYEANDLVRCERLSRDILARDQSNAVALGLLGLILLRTGHDNEASDLLCESVERGGRAAHLSVALAQLVKRSQNLSGRIVNALIASLELPKMTTDARVATSYGTIFEALSFKRQGDPAWCRRAFETIVVPWLQQLVERQQYAPALALEFMIYDEFVKQTETEDHFRFVYQAITPHLRNIGTALRANAAPAPKHASPVNVPTLAFLFHAASTLAHVDALRHMLNGYRQLAHKPWKPAVYCLAGYNDTMADWFDDLGIDVQFLDNFSPTRSETMLGKLTWLKHHFYSENIEGVVWLSAPVWMTTAFTMRIAEIQIWWAMKYHSLSIPDIDMYVSSLSFKRTQKKFGNLWHSGRLQVARQPQTKSKNDVQRIRAAYAGKVILGSLGREEKLNSPPFLGAVSTILRENPNAIYLWTGRKKLDAIHLYFDEHGVAKQTAFVGWVDTGIYSQVLDVFLDSFPFGCGFTAMQAMAAGVPVVLMATPEDGTPNLDQLIWPLFDSDEVSTNDRAIAQEIFVDQVDGLLYQHALSDDDYVKRAQRLISDEHYRRRVGASYSEFARRMMSDPAESAAIYAEHFHSALTASNRGN